MADKKRRQKIAGKSVKDNSAKRKGNKIPKYMSHSNREDANFFFGKRTHAVRGDTLEELLDFVDATYIGKPRDEDGHI